ncbi:hypothetical protein [Mycobacteroides abscessus]|uniref:hypothetical protein n=1 Tax=Mycobacteroides abscessus TaxID=36809 RepID=UPI0018965F7A
MNDPLKFDSESTAFDVSSLTDQQFVALLIRNAHQPTRITEEWEHLTSSANIDRAEQVLTTVRDHITGDLQARRVQNEKFRAYCLTQKDGRKDWAAVNSEYEGWRKDASSYLRRVIAAISEVKKARKDQNRLQNSAQRNERPVIRQLALAIDRHRAWQAENDYCQRRIGTDPFSADWN